MATGPHTPTPPRPGVLRDLLDGVTLLLRGFGRYWRSPRLVVLGTIPALLALVLVLAALGALFCFLSDLTVLVTWFAEDWSAAARATARAIAGVALVGVALLLTAVTYTALTLVIGDPFYEVISKRIEEGVGGAPPELDVPWYVTLRWNLVDSLRLLALSVSISVPLFFAGFLPLLGQTVVPALGAVVGGWLLAVELTGVPFNRRGLRLADRRRLLRANRALAIGFGVPVFLLLLIPLAGVIAVPGAVAGSTLLTRRLLGQPLAARADSGAAGTRR
ncbi:MAG: EI24 domain-containing protein [Dactylosporangium sp.]|nr:EI24 domain-containing protein [Dactylosporangium sp.]NNJ61732.1 EI24 domain-containing protein [Dactylosporangium sp.]